MNGVSLHVAGRLLGHRRASTTNRYVPLDDATLSLAVERVAMTIDRKLQATEWPSTATSWKNCGDRRCAARRRNDSMRRNAGSFAREKALQKTFLMLVGLGIGFGLLLAGIFNTVVAPRIGNDLTVILYIALAGAFLAAVLTFDRFSRWSLDNLWKGVDAEKRIGQIIEYAITAENCAVAQLGHRNREGWRHRSHRRHFR